MAKLLFELNKFFMSYNNTQIVNQSFVNQSKISDSDVKTLNNQELNLTTIEPHFIMSNKTTDSPSVKTFTSIVKTLSEIDVLMEVPMMPTNYSNEAVMNDTTKRLQSSLYKSMVILNLFGEFGLTKVLAKILNQKRKQRSTDIVAQVAVNYNL